MSMRSCDVLMRQEVASCSREYQKSLLSPQLNLQKGLRFHYKLASLEYKTSSAFVQYFWGGCHKQTSSSCTFLKSCLLSF